jgi:ComF family protein
MQAGGDPRSAVMRPGEIVTDLGASLLTPVLNALLPPRCLRCGGGVDRPGALCAACWEQVDFIGPPMCSCCGFPFELAPAEGTRCGACERRAPAYDHARAVMAYDAGSRDLILGFKHADRTEGAPAYAAWMARAAADLLDTVDLIAPVPLHRWRLLRRRYNQAALLANGLAARTGLPSVPDLLIRKRNNPSQGHLSPEGRWRNVRGVFAPHPGRTARLAGKRVLLVDDVLTSGATVEACAKVLRRGGATGVDVVTLARVVRPR